MGLNDMIQFFRQIPGKLSPTVYAGMQGPATMQQMAFIRELQRELRQKDDLESPLNELKIVVFDLETTGFHPEKGDQIISIGAIKMTGSQMKMDETFYSLVKTDIPLSEEISTLTSISNEDLYSAPIASEALLKFLKFIQSDILVAHHSFHEKSFMQKLTWDLLKLRFEHRIIDTSFLIRISTPSARSLSLDEVCNRSGIEVKNRHHALGDAIMTAKVWSHYLQLATEKGFHNLREVYEFISK
ncbi:exonuclease domain-containing protein [Neobacillus dielmonensis]|uniref:exonuclease domain-containing protein n=1 Tax=Neobacillus dielmonensis TaxID=1347369 RepID=UPI0005A90134|nr:exonuclease domain-containing protein [Neobacillus dielmonensis]